MAMLRFREKIAALFAESEGATAIEYGLIAALIALGAMAGIQGFGLGLSNMWNYVAIEVIQASQTGPN